MECIWHRLALNVNINAGPQRNCGGVKDGWIAMSVAGPGKRGDVILPCLRLSVLMKPGSILPLRAELLEHYIDDFDGERVGSVAFFHKAEYNSTLPP